MHEFITKRIVFNTGKGKVPGIVIECVTCGVTVLQCSKNYALTPEYERTVKNVKKVHKEKDKK